MVIRVNNIVKKFGSFCAVDDISFSVQEGEILGFLGPNGAGKTTTIAMLLGLLRPTTGSITIFGLDRETHHEEIMQRLGYSSAYVRAPWRLKVKEHLRVFADIYALPDKAKAVDEMLTTFSLQENAETFAGDLSAGNMAKLNLAKAFIHSPDVVLLDEPTSSLDPEVAREVRQFLLRVQKERKTTMLLTSHNMMEIEELADRVIFINHGKIIAEDIPDNLSKNTQKARLSIIVRGGMNKLLRMLQKDNMSFTTHDNNVSVHMFIAEVPIFLTNITSKGIVYTDISIERPTLEDYFISLLQKK